MFVKEKEAKIFQRPTCIVHEYGGLPNLDLAVAEIKGDYPQKGWVRNTQVDMTYFVIEGKGEFYFENERHEIEAGDLVMIEKSRWYRVKGNFKAVMVSSPAWSPDQYEEKDEL